MNTDKYLVFDLGYAEGFNGLHTIALLYVENGRIMETYYTELADKYITWHQKASLKMYDEHKKIWDEIKEIVGFADKMICFRANVHKTNFIITFNKFASEIENYTYIDVSRTAQDNLTECKKYGRKDLADYFGLEYKEENRTKLDDAKLSFEVFQRLLAVMGHDSLNSLLESKKTKKEDDSVAFYKKIYGEADMDGIVYFENKLKKEDIEGMAFLVTGEFEKYPGKKRSELEKKLVEIGGIKKESISKLLNIVIIGKDAGPKKIEALKKLQNAGLEIKVVNEKMMEDII